MEPNTKAGASRRTRKEQDQRFLIFKRSDPFQPWSLISPINTNFNGILENYYGSTCYPTFGDFILRPSNGQKSFLFSNIADRFAAASFVFIAEDRRPRKTLLCWPPKCFSPVSNSNQRTANPDNLTNSKQCILYRAVYCKTDDSGRGLLLLVTYVRE